MTIMEDPQSLEEVASRLQRNDEGYTTLQLQMNPGYEARDVNILTEAIQGNQKLEAIDFFGILGGDDVNEAVRRLFFSFASLPNLKSLRVSGYCEGMVDALCRVLNQALNLEDLTIIYVQLDIGNNSEFNDCLRYHQKLKVFKILYCQFPEFLRDEDYLNDIILTLSKVPTLQKVILSPISDSGLGQLSMEAITRLCRSLDDLEQLQIFGFSAPSGTTNLAPVTWALEEKNTIKDLRLPISFNKDSWIGIAKLIGSSNELETLILDVSFLPKQDEKVIFILAEALQQNTKLSRLDIFCDDNNCFNEKTLEKFGFSLESNLSLREVSFFCRQGSCTTPLIDLYTKLNGLNRGDLLHGNSVRSEWVDKLFEANDDISCLYYFLSRNPSLCSVDE